MFRILIISNNAFFNNIRRYLESRDELIVRGPCRVQIANKEIKEFLPHVVVADFGELKEGLEYILEAKPVCIVLANSKRDRSLASIWEHGIQRLILDPSATGKPLFPLTNPVSVQKSTDFITAGTAEGNELQGSLSKREREILALQARGLEYKQIALITGLSLHTVNNHLYSARKKLGVHSGIEAINVAYTGREDRVGEDIQSGEVATGRPIVESSYCYKPNHIAISNHGKVKNHKQIYPA